jgi:hypothetical protein
MTLGLVGLSAVVILVGLVWIVRAVLRMRTHQGDGSTALLSWACERLPPERADWGRAMCSELACIDRRSDRWRFALGGLRAAATARLVGRLAGRPSATAIICGAFGCTGLTVATFAIYPEVLAERKLPLLLTVLASVLVGYVVLALAQAPVAGAPSGRVRWTSLVSGVVLGVLWIVFATAWWNLHGWPMIAAIVIALLPGAYAARTSGGRAAGIRTVTATGLIAGLVGFVGLAVDAFATAHGPYDASQVDQFTHTGYVNPAAYWMGEGLATAVMMLLFIPVLTILVGSLGAVAGGLRRPARND